MLLADVHRVFVTLLVLGVVLMSSPGRCPATTPPRTGRHNLPVAQSVALRPLALPDDPTRVPDIEPTFVSLSRVNGVVQPARPSVVQTDARSHRTQPRRLLRLSARPADDPAH
jgi:hypothetical protein